MACDESIGHYAGRGPTEELWERIKLYVEEKEGTLESIKGEFLSGLIDGFELYDDEEVNDFLKEMVEADIGACNYLLALNGLDEIDFMPLDKEKNGSLAAIIAFASLMIFVVLYFVLSKKLQFICGAFISIGGLVAYFLDNNGKLSKLYLGLSILGSIGFILGVLVLIITIVRM